MQRKLSKKIEQQQNHITIMKSKCYCVIEMLNDC